MNAIGLMYHDVVPAGRGDASGFPGGDAARYKLTPLQFAAHLEAIRRRLVHRPATVDPRWLDQVVCTSGFRCFITFDDGGASAAAAADALEAFGWRGHFFITTDYIGAPGFLTRAQIEDLHRRGHVVGSHSCTHPLRMAHCSPAQLRDEWTRSVEALGAVVGGPVSCASVPGGGYSRAVGEAAAGAGIRFLFTSRPSVRVHRCGDMLVCGRYAVGASTTPATAAAVAAGRVTPRLAQLLWWDAKAIGKAAAGDAYLAARARLLGGSDRIRWGAPARPDSPRSAGL